MITSYDVEFGPKIGFGGLCVLRLCGYLNVLCAHYMLYSGEVYKGMWNKLQVAIKVVRTDSGLIPSPMVRRGDLDIMKSPNIRS
jgi:hypothetical protein